MLSDIELFIVSWTLLLSSLALFGVQEMLIIREVRKRDAGQEVSQARMRNYSAVILVMFIAVNIVGLIVTFLNWIPVTEYNDATLLFRVFSIPFGAFGVLMTLGSVCMFLRRKIPSVLDDMDQD